MAFARRLLIPCLFLMQLSSIARADTPPADQSTWPEKVVINVGDVRTRLDGPKLWTLSGIDYQNVMMATEDSAYGTVLTIRNVGHLGTAHFLDAPNKPGKVEKELVSSLKLFIEDKPVTDFKPSMELKGNSFRMERTSKIREVDLTSSISLRDNVLIETAHLRATAPVDLQNAIPVMYAWSPGNTVYLFGNDQGVEQRGEFVKEGATDARTIKNRRWVAEFNPATGKGSVCYVTKHPSLAESSFLLVDAPGVYRKVALYALEDKIIPTGFDGTYQTASTFFSGTEQDWEQQALKKVEELKKLGDPLPPAQ